MSGHEFKAQLKEALSSAVGYFQDGGDPNAACVKAANEAGFNADQADRLVETFNTARVICHYKSADDKTSSCSLADKETVRGQLTLPQLEEKSAGCGFTDYDFYKQAEVDHVVRQTKEAEFELKDEPISKEAAAWLKEREVRTIRDLAKEASEQARATRSLADEVAEKAAHDLSRDVDLDRVHDRMARIVRAYALDDRYAPGVEKLAEFLPSPSDPSDISHLLKYAARHIVDTSDLDGIMAQVKEASDLVAEASALEAYAAEMDKLAQEAEKPEGEKAPAKRDGLGGMLVVQTQKAAPSGGKSSGGSDHSGRNSLIAYLRDSWKAQHDTESQARVNKATEGLNNVRRQLILQDLLVRDKILSQEDPNNVMSVYRSIHQVSPDTTLNKEVLRSMMRSAVQSVAISPFDAKALVDLDKSRRQAYDQKTTVKEEK